MSIEDAREHLDLLATTYDEKLVIFQEVAEHVTRLVRSLSQPASHVMLIGKGIVLLCYIAIMKTYSF